MEELDQADVQAAGIALAAGLAGRSVGPWRSTVGGF
jgi:hypothetical protein